jgi:hypothetical protein
MNLNILTPGVGPAPFRESTGTVVRDKCDISPYQIKYFQIGVGASSVAETSSVYALGGPLTDAQYGGPSRSVKIVSGLLYIREDVPFEDQSFIEVENQGQLGTSSLVSIIHLDESTANGQSINEVGLFVDNPFLVTNDRKMTGVSPSLTPQLGGESPTASKISGKSEEKGQLLAAYRHITPIQKESYFSLMIRWTVNFSIPRT